MWELKGFEVFSTWGSKMSLPTFRDGLSWWWFDSRSFRNSETEYDEEVEDANEETDEEDLLSVGYFLVKVFCHSEGILRMGCPC